MACVATLVGHRHVHVDDRQSVHPTGREAKDVLDHHEALRCRDISANSKSATIIIRLLQHNLSSRNSESLLLFLSLILSLLLLLQLLFYRAVEQPLA